MEIGPALVLGILITVVLLALWGITYPLLKRYRFTIKRVEPKKKRHTRSTKKRRKSFVIRIG